MAQTIDLGALRFVYRGVYSASTTYGFNDVVQFGGGLYVVASDTTVTGVAPSTTAPWAQMLPPGASLLTGTLAQRPATFSGNRIYIVTGDTAANNGLAYFDTGSAWVQFGGGAAATSVRAVAANAADTPIRGTGVASQTGDLLQLQNSTGTNLWRVAASGRSVEPLVANVTPTYDSSGRVSTVVYKDSAGVTVLTSTLTYTGTGTQPATQTDVGDGRTDVYTMTWNADGTLASRTATRSTP